MPSCNIFSHIFSAESITIASLKVQWTAAVIFVVEACPGGAIEISGKHGDTYSERSAYVHRRPAARVTGTERNRTPISTAPRRTKRGETRGRANGRRFLFQESPGNQHCVQVQRCPLTGELCVNFRWVRSRDIPLTRTYEVYDFQPRLGHGGSHFGAKWLPCIASDGPEVLVGRFGELPPLWDQGASSKIESYSSTSKKWKLIT